MIIGFGWACASSCAGFPIWVSWVSIRTRPPSKFSISHAVTDEALSKINRRRRVSVSVPSFLILPELLSTGDLIAVAPERLTPADETLVVREPPVDIPGFTKAMVWHGRTERDEGQRWIRSFMTEAYSREAL
ncbi:hypothetical protein FYM84_13120 [Pseudomonas sp. CAH-1]|nr:hypothetical protein [Pseudomonas sp. CAH-1]